MKFRFSKPIWIVAILIAWAFDLMFFEKEPGISMTIAAVLCLAGGLVLAYWEGKKPARASFLLIPPIMFFAVMLFIRREGGTTFTNLMLTTGGLAILAVTLLGGKWLRYSLTDYFVKFFQLAFGALINGARLAFSKKTAEEGVADAPEHESPASAPATSGWKTYGVPVLRGLLIAIPVIALLAALLASADPIFSAGLEDLLDIFRLEKLGEYLLRAMYILIIGYILAGVYIHSLTASEDEKLIGVEKQWLPAFLGIVEAIVILGAVDLLFATFVGIQFRYFFGGQANISLEGFTYAEYARRGFGELLSVAIISLLLFLGLSSITRRDSRAHRLIFGGLGIVLVALVLVMLVSAFQRLVLYETAYGFTSLRTYTHVFMIWLGILLFATIVIEILQRQRAFALMAVIVLVGFGVTINLLNADAFIVRQNVALAESGLLLEPQSDSRMLETTQSSRYPLDMQTLNNLSADATPELVAAFQRPGLSTHSKERLAAVLACKVLDAEQREENVRWVSFHLAESRAAQSLRQVTAQLPTLKPDEWGMVEVQDDEFYCYRAIE